MSAESWLFGSSLVTTTLQSFAVIIIRVNFLFVQETIEAVKTKPFEELTDKQRKFLEYQQKLREKWHKRKLGDGKKFQGGVGGGGVSSSGTGQSSSGASGAMPSSEQGEDDDGGFKFASDDDDDEDYEGRHLDRSPASSRREGRKEVGKEINGKFVVDS